ncbi:HD domain-containing protein [Ensifer canadensis]
MPDYTVHDISHLDALWEMASLVVNDDLTLNPAEAFVLGAAILLHDASMTLAAYPGGIEELKTLTEWQDFVAISKTRTGSEPTEALVLSNVLRMLHAKNAEALAVHGWPSPGAIGTEYLIQDNDVRRYYGPTIGQIAHSHWWPTANVRGRLDRRLGAMTPVAQHEVDVLKLACILRVADAIHLDRRRAPPFVRALDRPGGIASLHWAFQGRLGFPHIEGDALQFTAGEPCSIEESDSWWLGYDAFALADKELRETDLLLRDLGRPGLKVRRVKGVEDPPNPGTQRTSNRVEAGKFPPFVYLIYLGLFPYLAAPSYTATIGEHRSANFYKTPWMLFKPAEGFRAMMAWEPS